jgi:hypothetical protein
LAWKVYLQIEIANSEAELGSFFSKNGEIDFKQNMNELEAPHSAHTSANWEKLHATSASFCPVSSNQYFCIAVLAPCLAMLAKPIS